MNATTIPVTVTEEAARRVALLGARGYLDTMLEWTRNHVPNLGAIVVRPGITGLDILANLVVINAHCTFDEENLKAVPVECDWANWKVQAIPLEVCRHFIMSCTSRPVPTPEPGTILL